MRLICEIIFVKHSYESFTYEERYRLAIVILNGI